MAEVLEGEELRAFLLAGTRTAKVAVTRKDGSPAVAPIWFVMDGDDLLFTTMNTSLKYKAMKRDPRISLCVDEEEFPYAFAVIRGRAEIEELSEEELLPWSTQIAARYVPADRVEEYGRRNADPNEVLVRVRPEQVFAYTGIAD